MRDAAVGAVLHHNPLAACGAKGAIISLRLRNDVRTIPESKPGSVTSFIT